MPLGLCIEYFRGSLAEEERSILNVSQKTRSLGAVISKQNNKQKKQQQIVEKENPN